MNSENAGHISSEEMNQWCSDLENCVATGDRVSILKLLNRFSTNTTDYAGNTLLLHYVTKSEDENGEIVQYLIKAGFDVNAKNNIGEPALIKAVDRKMIKTVKVLIKYEAIIDHKFYPNHIGPLHCAAKGVCVEILRILLEAGCNVNAKEKNFLWTPLDNVLDNNRETALEMVKILLDAGASHDHAYYWDSIGPLHKACLNQDPKIVKLLLDAGYEASAKDICGRTPLHMLIRMGKSPNAADDEDDNVASMVKLLIQAGADVNARSNDGRTALYDAVKNIYNKAFDLLREAGAELNAVDNDGNTLLHMLGQENDKRIYLVKLIIQAGVDINKVNSYGRNCIFNAVENASVELLTYFIQRGAKLDLIDCYGMDLLTHALVHWICSSEDSYDCSDHDACFKTEEGKRMIDRQVKCIEILCKHGFDIMKYGESLFHKALELYCHSKILHALVRQGAIVNFNDNRTRFIMNIGLDYNLELQQRIIIQHAAICNSLKEGKGIVNFNLKELSKEQVRDYDNCIEELKGLKVFWVDESMSLTNLIEGPVCSRFILNDHLKKLFKTGVIAKTFPLFNDILSENFEKERKKYEFLLKVTAGLKTLIKFDEESFYFIYENILSYLDYQDLRNLSPLVNMKNV